MSGALEVRSVTKAFVGRDGRTTTALRNLSLRVEPSEFLFLLGASGCGKSTLMNLIAGFEEPTRGQVLVAGKEVRHPDASRTVVFQNSQGSLFPWMSAQENVEFGLKMAGMPRAERQERARKYLALVHLDRFGTKLPSELSGGMKQRVQIAGISA